MAEGLMREKINKYSLKARVDSAGFESFHLNDSPDYRAIKVMHTHGIDISRHKMRLFRIEDFQNFDKIYVMDQYNYQDVLALSGGPEDASKVDLILNVLEPGKDRIVPDPYYGGVSGFENVFQLLDKATEVIARQLLESKEG
jgi:protein-tyrosine phosphatase